MMRGSCLCGAVSFEVEGTLDRRPEACHCSQCRKQTSHVFVGVNVRRKALTVHGGDRVSWYRSSEKVRRGGKLMFGHAFRFDRIAAASHAAAGFVTVEELIGLNVLNRFVVPLCRRPRATLPNSAVPLDRDPPTELSECEQIRLDHGR
jgi:hypothetical protein